MLNLGLTGSGTFYFIIITFDANFSRIFFFISLCFKLFSFDELYIEGSLQNEFEYCSYLSTY